MSTCLCPRLASSGLEQSLEERAVPRQGDSQILGGGLLALRPLALQVETGFGETRGDPLDQVRYERVCFHDRLTGLVDEARLNLVPASAKGRQLVVTEERLILASLLALSP